MRAIEKVGVDSNLDILRSVAVMAVFVTHTLQVLAGCKVGEALAYRIDTRSLGEVGVLIFFVHTCLVLMQSLERAGTDLSGWSLFVISASGRRFAFTP